MSASGLNSWTTAVNGAQPGYIMQASAQVGDTYCWENAPGIAQVLVQPVEPKGDARRAQYVFAAGPSRTIS